MLGTAGKADTFNVATPGTLEQIVNSASNDSITEMTVTGTINWKDLKFIRSCEGRVKALQVIDLSDVSIEESEDSCYSVAKYSLSDILGDYYYGYFFYSNNPRRDISSKSSGLGGEAQTVKYYNNDLGGLFSEMKTLREVHLPKTVTDIGELCFYECTSLETVTHSATQMRYIGQKAFYDCKSLNMTIPNTVDSIGESAFVNCESMEGTLDMTNMANVEDRTFKGCGFNKVVISPYLEELNDFSNCENLTSVEFPANCILKTGEVVIW